MYKNITLRCVIFDLPEVVEMKDNVLSGFLGRRIESLLAYSRKKFNLTMVIESLVGTLQENNSWSGMIGRIQRDEADFSLMPIRYYQDAPIDLSALQMVASTNILSIARLKSKVQTSFTIMANFPSTLWLGLLIAIFICSLFYKIGPLSSFIENFLILARYIIMQGYIKSNILHQNILKSILCFSTMIIAILFSNIMSTDLVTMDDSNILNSFDQLNDENIVPVILESDTFYVREFESATSYYKTIRDRVLKYNTVVTYAEYHRIQMYFDKYEEKLAVIMSSFLNCWLASTICRKNFWFSKETIFEEGYYFWLNKNFKGPAYNYYISFSYITHESGVIKKIAEEFCRKGLYLKTKYSCFVTSLSQIYKPGTRILELKNIKILFITFIVFYLISILSLFVERLYFIIRKRRNINVN